MKKIFALLSVCVLLLAGCVNSVRDRTIVNEPKNSSSIPFHFIPSANDKEIWGAFRDSCLEYEKITDFRTAEKLAYIDVSKEFGISILEVNRIFTRTDGYDCNLDFYDELTDADLDAEMIGYIDSYFDYVFTDGKWYYNGDAINVGYTPKD